MSDLEKLKNTSQIGMSQDGAVIDMLGNILHVLEGAEMLGMAQRIDDEQFRISHVVGDCGGKFQGLTFAIGEGFLGHVAATSRPGYWSSISHDPRAALFTRNGIRPTAVFCYPVVRKQEVVGVLFGALSTEAKHETLTLLELISSILGRQMLIDSLEEHLHVGTVRLSSIIELSQAMTAVENIKNILYILLDMSLNLVQGPFTCIAFKLPDEASSVELLSRGMTRKKAAEYGRNLADAYIGRKIGDSEQQMMPFVRRLESTPVIECPLLFQDEVSAILAVAVANERKIEEFKQLVHVLSVIGSAAIQRIQTGGEKDWAKDIALVHRASSYWAKDTYEHALEVQELARAFANKIGLSYASTQSIEQAALLSPYDVEFVVTELLPGLADDVIQVLGDFQALCKPSSIVPDSLNEGGQILALAEYHLGKSDINLAATSPALREKFQLFMLQKDVERQQVFPNRAKDHGPVNTGSVSLDELPSLEQLTPREQEVLELLVTGMGNKEIAQTLFISEHTVKNHLTNIFQKLGVNDRTQAIALVYQYIQ